MENSTETVVVTVATISKRRAYSRTTAGMLVKVS